MQRTLLGTALFAVLLGAGACGGPSSTSGSAMKPPPAAKGAADEEAVESSADDATREAAPPPAPLTMQEIRQALGSSTDPELELTLVSLTQWQQPVNVSDPINSEADDFEPFVTDDGQLFLFASSRHGGLGGVDLWFSANLAGRWSPPLNMGPAINSINDEWGADLTVPERMYFTSNAVGAQGRADLWIAMGEIMHWDHVVSLGSGINSGVGDRHPSVTGDGRTLYFASNRRGTVGWQDLWVTTGGLGKFSEPMNLGEPVNSKSQEWSPCVTRDGRALIFASTRPGGFGGYDLWVTVKTKEGWSRPVNMGAPVNTRFQEMGACLSGDERTLYFATNREGGKGGYDIWRAERAVGILQER